MKVLIIFTTIFILASSELTAEEISLTLHETIALALRDNRDILLEAEEVKKAKLKISESKADLLPALDFTADWTDTRGYYRKDLAAAKTQTTLKQYLYKGGKTKNTIKQDEYTLLAKEALLEKAKMETVLNAKKAFYTLLLSNEFALLNKDIVENTRAHLNLIEARHQKGEASLSDILRIKEALSNVEQAYAASLNQIETSAALLKKLLHIEETIKITANGQFGYNPVEVAFDEAFLQAMKNRPEIKQYEAEGRAAKKKIEVEKAGNRPSVYASWDYYSRSTASLTFSPTRGWQDYNIIGLSVSWPIFDGLATKAKIEQAIVDLKTTQLEKEKLIKEIALEIKSVYLDLKNAIAKVKTNETEFISYEDNLKVIKEKYKNGIASSLDLNDAHLSLEVARFNNKQAVYDYVIAKANFDKAMGG